MSDKTVNLSFRVTPKRQEELKVISARRHQSNQRMLEQGLALLLGEAPGSKELPVPKKLRQEDQELIRKVISLIDSDEGEKLPMIRMMLKNYVPPKRLEGKDEPKKEAPEKGGKHRRSA